MKQKQDQLEEMQQPQENLIERMRKLLAKSINIEVESIESWFAEVAINSMPQGWSLKKIKGKTYFFQEDKWTKKHPCRLTLFLVYGYFMKNDIKGSFSLASQVVNIHNKLKKLEIEWGKIKDKQGKIIYVNRNTKEQLLEDPRVLCAKKMINQIIDELKQKQSENDSSKTQYDPQKLENLEQNVIFNCQISDQIKTEIFSEKQNEEQIKCKVGNQKTKDFGFEIKDYFKEEKTKRFEITSPQKKQKKKLHQTQEVQQNKILKKNKILKPKKDTEINALELTISQSQKFPSIQKQIKFEPNSLKEFDQKLQRKNEMLRHQISFKSKKNNKYQSSQNQSYNSDYSYQNLRVNLQDKNSKLNSSYNVSPKLDYCQENLNYKTFSQENTNRQKLKPVLEYKVHKIPLNIANEIIFVQPDKYKNQLTKSLQLNEIFQKNAANIQDILKSQQYASAPSKEFPHKPINIKLEKIQQKPCNLNSRV